MSHLIKLQILESPEEVAAEAARRIAQLLRTHERPVLGLATGSTPEKTYSELVRLHRDEQLSFRNARTFNLDEYSGLPGDHPQSYRHFMQTRLFDHVDVRPWNTRVLDGTTRLPQLECDAFEAQILAAGGVDLWLLGIGANGHIAFNEPGSPVDSRTRLVALTPSTIVANSDGRFFTDPAEVPRTALTAGIATIRNARRILLLATGESKARAVRDAIKGPYSSDCPASLLQDHPACEFLLDRAAASLLQRG
jgi:glucosamine-6-phosphate deaminase